MSVKTGQFMSKLPGVWRDIAVLLLVGIFLRGIFSLGTGPILWPDSRIYLTHAAHMVDEGIYWRHEVYRTPVYPLFLSIFIRVFGYSPDAGDCIVLAQRCLGLGAGIFLFFTLRRAFSERVAFWASLTFLVAPVQLFYETSILTEALFIFLLMGFLWLAGRVLERSLATSSTILDFVLLGGAGAILSLARPIGQLLLVLFLGFVVVRVRFTKKIILQAVVSGITFFVVVFPWLKVNHDHYGFWGISRDFGINLFHRVLDVDKTPLPPTSTDVFIREQYTKALEKPGTTYFRVLFALTRHLKAMNVPRDRIGITVDQRLADFAQEVLVANPQLFIPKTLDNLWRLFVSPRRSPDFCGAPDGVSYVCTDHVGITFRGIARDPARLAPEWRAVSSFLIRALSNFEWLVAALAIIGIILCCSGSGWEQRAILVATIFYFTGLAALLNCPEDRFRLPVDGILYAFAVVGGLRLWDALVLHRKQSDKTA